MLGSLGEEPHGLPLAGAVLCRWPARQEVVCCSWQGDGAVPRVPPQVQSEPSGSSALGGNGAFPFAAE